MGTILIAITGFVGMVAITVTLTAIKAVVEKEYDGWAPLLSRALVRLSGRLCPPRAAEFEDHYAAARDEGNTGMMGAVAAIVWSVRVAPMRALTWRPRPKKDLVIRGETATLRLDAVVTPRTLQATATIHSVSIVATARIARGDEESGA